MRVLWKHKLWFYDRTVLTYLHEIGLEGIVKSVRTRNEKVINPDYIHRERIRVEVTVTERLTNEVYDRISEAIFFRLQHRKSVDGKWEQHNWISCPVRLYYKVKGDD